MGTLSGNPTTNSISSLRRWCVTYATVVQSAGQTSGVLDGKEHGLSTDIAVGLRHPRARACGDSTSSTMSRA
jgi:hypothetical protein